MRLTRSVAIHACDDIAGSLIPLARLADDKTDAVFMPVRFLYAGGHDMAPSSLPAPSTLGVTNHWSEPPRTTWMSI